MNILVSGSKTKQLNLSTYSKGARNFDLRERILDYADDTRLSITPNIKGQRQSFLGIYFKNFGLELFVELNQVTRIGRSYPQIFDYNGIDLSAYDAYTLGVSREHAFFKYVGNQLILIDNQSVNGTYINNHSLEPLLSYIIKDGDVIQLGQLEFVITEL